MMNQIAKHEPAETVQIVHADNAMVAMIERVVMDPNASLDKLERMLQMRERLEDRAREAQEREDRKEYFREMAACQKMLPVVIKNQKNDHTRSKYADLAAIERQAMPTIHEHGFTVSFQPAGEKNGHLLIKWTVAHEAGHVETDTAEIPIDAAGAKGGTNKTGTQAFGSTMTYGRRYLLCLLFNISTGDDLDGNRDVRRETISADQFMELRETMEKSGADEARFLGFLRVDALEDLPADRFGMAMNALRQKIKQGAEDAGNS